MPTIEKASSQGIKLFVDPDLEARFSGLIRL